MNKKNVLPKSQQPAVVHPSLQQAGKMVASLTNLRRDRSHCDVFLQVEGRFEANKAVGEVADESRGVWAHSAVLAAVSPYLYDRFKRSINKSTIEAIFVINDVNLETLRELVENIYSATALEVSVEKAKDLLAAATSLEVREVRDAACECLKRALSANNALGIHAAAVRHGCTILAAATTQYIYDHFQKVLMADELLALESDLLIVLLDTNRLAATKESAFDAVLRWMLHHPQHVNLKTLRKRVENMYSAISLVVSVKKAKELLAAATSLKVDEVQDMASVYLQRALSVDNALGIYTSAVLHNCTALAAAATRYIQNHFHLVLQAEELLGLEPDSMKALFNANRLAACNERAFDAVVRWIQHRPKERRHHLASLLQFVQLEQSTIDPELRDARALQVEQQDLQPPNTLLAMPTTNPKHSIVMQPERCSLAATDNPHRPRASALLVVGGWQNTGYTRDVLAYELSSGRWQSAAELPEGRSAAGVALLDDSVYVVGGAAGGRPQYSVAVYDVSRGSWTAGPSLCTPRWKLAVTALGGRLYAVGGGNRTVLSSVEALDPRDGVWRPVASMAASRESVGVAVLDGRLYATGGYNNNGTMNTIERYDPSADRWEPVKSMSQRRCNHGVATVEGTLYVVGGYDGKTTLRSVEQYRVGLTWEHAPSMTTARKSAAVTTHAGRVYVACGNDEGGNYLCSVAVLDPTKAAWSELPVAMPKGRTSAAAVVVDWSPPAP